MAKNGLNNLFNTMKKKYIVCVATILIFFLFLDYYGIIWHNNLLASRYDIHGIDVSHHQGDVDWQQVAESKKYKFAYIKATEGADFIDPAFEYNWNEARKAELAVGAYHFFSIHSSAEDQATNFISSVPVLPNSLPPVVDIEIPQGTDKGLVQSNLHVLLDTLESHYHIKPILYVTHASWRAYVKDDFTDYKIWIRDMVMIPILRDQPWTLWQYSNRGRVPGISTPTDLLINPSNTSPSILCFWSVKE
jgi:lysozyme